MEPLFVDEKPSKSERVYAQYIGVCNRIGQVGTRRGGQDIPPGKLEKLLYERTRLQTQLGDFFEVQ